MQTKTEFIHELIAKLNEFEANMLEWHDEELHVAEEYAQQLKDELEQFYDD